MKPDRIHIRARACRQNGSGMFAAEARPRPRSRSLRELQVSDLVAVFVRARGASVTKLELEALRPRRASGNPPGGDGQTRTDADLLRELDELARHLSTGPRPEEDVKSVDLTVLLEAGPTHSEGLLDLVVALVTAGAKPRLEDGVFTADVPENAPPYVHVAAETLAGREAELARRIPSKARPPKPPRTACARGHAYTSENTATQRGRAGRICRACKRASAAKRRATRRAARETAAVSVAP